MKRLRALVLGTVLVGGMIALLPAVRPPEAAAAITVLGDVDNDGTVTLKDAELVANLAVGNV
jgi:hypothetical protein